MYPSKQDVFNVILSTCKQTFHDTEYLLVINLHCVKDLNAKHVDEHFQPLSKLNEIYCTTYRTIQPHNMHKLFPKASLLVVND